MGWGGWGLRSGEGVWRGVVGRQQQQRQGNNQGEQTQRPLFFVPLTVTQEDALLLLKVLLALWPPLAADSQSHSQSGWEHSITGVTNGDTLYVS